MHLRHNRSALGAILLACCLALSGLALTAPSGAQAASAPRSRPVATITPATVTGGNQVTLSLHGFAARELLHVFVSGISRPIAALRADRFGALVRVRLRLPYAVPAGLQRITIVGARSYASASTLVTFRAVAVSVSLGASSATHGGTVLVTCHNFAPGELVTIRLSGVRTVLAVVRASAAGAIARRVTIPSSAGFGLHALYVTGATSLRTSAVAFMVARQQTSVAPSQTQTVTAVSQASAILSASTSSVVAGKTLLLSGHKFTANETVAISINGMAGALATVHASATGTLSVHVTIPATLARGIHIITATGLSSHLSAIVVVYVSASTTITPVPTATVTPSLTLTALPGSTILLSCNHFAANEAISITINGITTPLSVVTATATGDVVAHVTLPATLATGAYTITATGATSHLTATTIVDVGFSLTSGALPTTSTPVTPSLTVAVAQGSSLLFTGLHFSAREAITLALQGVSTRLAVVYASDSGALFARLTVPTWLAPGTYTLVAVGASSQRAVSLTFTVVAASAASAPTPLPTTPTTATITSTVTTVTAGSTITFTCSNFAPGEAISLTLNGAATPLAVVRASASGSVVVRLTLSSGLAPGVYTLAAVGATTRVVAATAFTVVQASTEASVTLSTSTSTVTPTTTVTTTPGLPVTVSCHNFTPGEAIVLSLSGQATPLAIIHASASGSATARIVIPTGVSLGQYAFTAVGVSSLRSVTFSLVLVATASMSSS